MLFDAVICRSIRALSFGSAFLASPAVGEYGGFGIVRRARIFPDLPQAGPLAGVEIRHWPV
jgi:hypothetical protein